MVRNMIHIDEEKCNGCGLCAEACHEGAIKMENGKAKLIRDDYCDGLGDCLPVCLTGAIEIKPREALPYDEKAVQANMAKHAGGGCPGSRAMAMKRPAPADVPAPQKQAAEASSQLMQWPVQIKLVPVNAPYFDGANLLIAADCCAYAYGNFHNEFMKNKISIIGCPKLDEGDYSEKLTEILKQNSIKSVTITRMEVPCCGGLEFAVKNALQNCGKMIPWQVVTISTDGNILDS